MKRGLVISVAGAVLGLLFCARHGAAQETAAEPASARGLVYVVPVHDMIERGLTYVIRRGVNEAVAQGAGAIVFDMHTPGGRLDAAEEIIDIIANISVPTFTFVNRNAISAGAIIAMGTDSIYMAPGSRIGDAMPIMVSPFGGAQEMPEAMQEKAVSYVAGLIRSTAQRKHHDPLLAEAMVRREMEYKIGDEVISPAGQLLTLTNVEAERVVSRDGRDEPLLSKGTAEDLPALLKAIGHGEAELRAITITPAEKIARYIEMLSALLLIGGLLGLYVEFKTPGFGLPGIAGILLLAIWFWGHHVAGLAGMGELVLFALGLILLLVEVFFIPGFGLVGSAGIAMMALAVLMAMVQHSPGLPVYRLPDIQIDRAMRTVGWSLAGLIAAALVLSRFLPRTTLFRRLVLETSETAAAGFSASAAPADLLGARGRADTPLRPAGIAVFGERRLNVVSRGDFIDAGAPVVVVETRGNRVVVEKEEPRALS
ncbi:MAG: hypothetical protein FJ225_02215 [Lentisphaerae bacterium]|nr:hypothetical protein [Lentisphaerota bacterium]